MDPFSGGTGSFEGFEAHAEVTADSDGPWHWRGTYSFDCLARSMIRA